MYITILFLTFISSIVSLTFGRFLSPKGVSLISCSCLFFCFILSVIFFFEVGFCNSSVFIKISPWLDCEMFDGSWGLFFDSLTIIMCFLIISVSTLVHLYSTSYMSHNPHQTRFMSYLSLFTFFMLMLVTSDNFLQLFFGWEGVGFCSYILINFWFTRLQANKSAIKAMLINKVGDFGLALAIFLIFTFFKSIDFMVVFSLVPYFINHSFYLGGFNFNLIQFISVFLFIGVLGKSAQLGLHTWLPDAMEGPTPVSALIHAATMVTAGVFLLARCSFIFEYSFDVLSFIAFIGTITVFFSASVGVFQNDLKKIIAFSTCSQLGYMVFCCGLSNYSVAIFHVFNHGYFKALLFLSAGSVIHAVSDEQDLRRLGGLINNLPFTYSMFVIGSLSLTGFPFLTGFYSKDLILEIAYSKFTVIGNFSYWLGLISASITAFYSFKLIYLSFIINPNEFKTSFELIEDAPNVMGLVLFFLSIGSIFFGFLLKELFVGIGTPFWGNSLYILIKNINFTDVEFIPVLIKWLPFYFTIFGIFFSIIFYHCFLYLIFYFFNISFVKKVYIFFNKKWYMDKIQNAFLGSVILKFSYNIFYKLLDKGFLEFLSVFSISNIIFSLSKQLIVMHNGFITQYALYIFLYLFIFINLYLLLLFFFLDVQIYLLFFIYLFFDNFYYKFV